MSAGAVARLDRYHAAVKGMTVDEHNDFRRSLIAALSLDATDEEWDDAVRFAKDRIVEFRARKAAR